MNRLADETSPYLLQHAENPVDWLPWGDEAFARARESDRPILLSVGYSACHWCHVMAHESFEDDETARLMNELFVNVKVDREERPDVDALSMDAVVALTGHGGWPTTVFLTPDGEPFYGGTYYPLEPRHGLPAFRQVLTAVAEAYRERPGEVGRSARELVERLESLSDVRPSADPLTETLLRDALRNVKPQFEPRWGGFGGAPKFPPASTLEFLLRMRLRFDDEEALAMAAHTLDGMALGGMWDAVGGGFHRYSVDAQWLVPHFEKMLYDNALLASAYAHGWAVTGEGRYREVAERTVEYVLGELSLPEGGFASAQDADTDGVEGLTFTWTADELAGVLGERRNELLQPFEHGRSIIRGELTEDERTRLLAAREQRPQPGRDDKAIASWNGLMLATLADAGRRLGRDDWLARARELADFILGPLSTPDGRLHRTYRLGRAQHAGVLDDALLLEDVDAGHRRAAREWMAAVGQAAGVRPLPERLRDAAADDDATQWHIPGVDPLGEADEIGRHAPVVDREPLAAACEPGHDLVAHHHDAVPVAEVPDAGEVAVGRNEDAVRAHDRLEDDGRHR
jgi:uncharacterized protein YyaL (SSP411 family)